MEGQHGRQRERAEHVAVEHQQRARAGPQPLGEVQQRPAVAQMRRLLQIRHGNAQLGAGLRGELDELLLRVEAQQHHVGQVRHAGQRAHLVYAANEAPKMEPFAFSFLRVILYGVLLVCSCGILGIVSVWYPQVFTRIARIRLPKSCVGDARYMLILVHEDGWRSKWIEVPVHRPKPSKSVDTTSKLPWVWFEYKRHRYVFNYEKGEFERYLATVNESLDAIFARVDTGLDLQAVTYKAELFGPNLVSVESPSIFMLVFVKVVHPYYLFQVFSALVWFFQFYTVYAIVIVCMSIISLVAEVWQEVANNRRLRKMVKSDNKVTVFRTGAAADTKKITLHETDLVPGDIVDIEAGSIVADMLLLTGACVVDEVALTGEAAPVNKEPAVGKLQITVSEAGARLKQSFLHSGSKVTRVRDTSGPCRAVVLSTGFSTGKGELLRSIMFPRELKFEFERDSYRYLCGLSILALATFLRRLVDFSHQGYGLWYTIIQSLDLVTTAVPPALPLVLTSGLTFALSRLRKGGIFCIDARRVNSCGQVTCFCFDKTGTLTEPDLHLVSADILNTKTNTLQNVGREFPDDMKLAMATCHGLSELDGEMQGYSLEQSMFEASEFSFRFVDARTGTLAIATSKGKDGAEGMKFGIIKRFAFDPGFKRSSVIVEDKETKERVVFVKGAPEAIRDISLAVPDDFQSKALRNAAEGYYCIAFGIRKLHDGEEVDLDDRVSVEQRVSFLGIALFQNEIKEDSKATFAELYDAEIDLRIITGDNALTAVTVARQLNMKLRSKVAIVDVVDESLGEVMFHDADALRRGENLRWSPFNSSNMARIMVDCDVVVTGAALNVLKNECSDESMNMLISSTPIFARTRPEEKTWIVEHLTDMGHVVGMVGDGTNDCGALKVAHVGLALSSAEASIIAPFTSSGKRITDVPRLLREGRCALSTSFLAFKFMVLYPVIQTSMTSVLGVVGTMFSNNEYLYDDMFVLLLSVTMLYNAAAPKLSRRRPPNTLFSRTIMLSIFGQILLYIAFFAIHFVLMEKQSWLCHRMTGMDLVRANMSSSSYEEAIPDPVERENCMFYLDYLGEIDTEADDIKFSQEGTVIWIFGHLQYFAVCAAFNMTDTFRKPFYTNWFFMASFAASLVVTIWILFDVQYFHDSLQVLDISASFRLKLFFLFIGNWIAAMLWEYFAVHLLPQCWENRADRNAQAQAKAQALAQGAETPILATSLSPAASPRPDLS